MPNWTPAQECAMQIRGRDVLISAAAGSGKTATLTERIIRALLEVDEDGRHTGDISRMLVVTFTRAAAAELRARISSALSEAIAAHPQDKYLYRQLVALGSAHICTIDSFYLEPVRANFERLGLPSTFRLADDSELMPLKEQLLDQLIEQHYAASAASTAPSEDPLDALNDNAFALAMDDLLPNRDRGDTAAVLLELFNKLIAFPEGLELLRMGADRLQKDASLPFGQTPEGCILSDALGEELMYDCNILRPACELLLTHPETAKNYLPSFAHDLNTAEQLLADLQAGRWESAAERAAAYTPISLKIVKNVADIFPDIEEIKTARTAITKTLRSLPKRYFAQSIAEMQQQMLHTARTQRMLYALLSDYDRAIRELKMRRGVLDFSDVRRYLLQLLLDADGKPTDIARSLCDRFDAVYIDEYQDVDTVQDLIFSTIGAKGNRFMVGDIKQSIYSFRGAEPSIFSNYRRAFYSIQTPEQAPSDPRVGCCVFMSENFRCDRAIIAFANAVCGHTFRVCTESLGYKTEDDLVYGKAADRPTVNTRLVILETPPRATRTPDPDPATALNPEAVYIADEIARLIREEHHINGAPIHARDIAILMRGLSAAADISEALRAHGIRASYALANDLATDPDMTLLINLLSVIDNPRDDVPLTGLLTAEGSPFTLSDLLALRREGFSASLYDDILVALDESSSAINADKIVKWHAFLERLEAWRALAATLPADRLLRRLSTEPFFVDKATSPAYLTLYDKARSYQNSSFCGLYQFMQYLRRLLKTKDGLCAAGLQSSDDAVSIMSIHKSKGLQFPVVFVASCATTFNTDDLRSTVMFDPSLGAAAKIYVPETAELRETVTRRAIARRLEQRLTEEEMRLLYVALTRAQERLYVTAKLIGGAATPMGRAHAAGSTTRFAVMSANCYLDWILAALATKEKQDDPLPCDVLVLNRDHYRHPHPVEGMTPSLASEASVPSTNDNYYQNIIEYHRNYTDPRALLRTLPTKAAASKLRSAMLDGVWLPEEMGGESDGTKTYTEATDMGDAEAVIRHRIELMRSAKTSFAELLHSDKRATAAERGTATHLFMQHCDFSRLDDIESEIARLVTDKFLPRRAADILNRNQLRALRDSDLARLAKNARAMWREQHFDRFVPYTTLTRNPALAKQLEGHALYVQGSIDLIVEDQAGELWLFDYKTDRLLCDDERVVRAQLLEHHGDQLRIYAEAVREMFGRAPDHVCIYSLPLARSVELTDQL